MSEYALQDFVESLGYVELDKASVSSVIKAWGESPEGQDSWEGGFVLELRSGRYAYLEGFCTVSGWGCAETVSIEYADVLGGLDIPSDRAWDENPADLNRWLRT